MEEQELEKSLVLRHSTQLNLGTKTLTSIEIPLEEKQGQQERGKWTWQEELLYFRFIKSNRERLNKQSFTKKYCKFSKMSEFIGTKTVSQCRSHYQKTVAKFNTLEGFLLHFEARLEKEPREGGTKEVGTQTELVPGTKSEKREKQKRSSGQSSSEKYDIHVGQYRFRSNPEAGSKKD